MAGLEAAALRWPPDACCEPCGCCMCMQRALRRLQCTMPGCLRCPLPSHPAHSEGGEVGQRSLPVPVRIQHRFVAAAASGALHLRLAHSAPAAQVQQVHLHNQAQEGTEEPGYLAASTYSGTVPHCHHQAVPRAPSPPPLQAAPHLHCVQGQAAQRCVDLERGHCAGFSGGQAPPAGARAGAKRQFRSEGRSKEAVQGARPEQTGSSWGWGGLSVEGSSR